MRQLFRDSEHLLRLALLFGVVGVAFLVARALFIPEGFGTYGHYRAGALDDNRARPLSFAGRAACLDCHDAVDAVKTSGKHAGVGCEACHGALAAHADDPTAAAPAKLEPKSLCLVCHERNVAKPAGFPQIDPKDHAGDDPCQSCHAPHSPLPV